MGPDPKTVIRTLGDGPGFVMIQSIIFREHFHGTPLQQVQAALRSAQPNISLAVSLDASDRPVFQLVMHWEKSECAVGPAGKAVSGAGKPDLYGRL